MCVGVRKEKRGNNREKRLRQKEGEIGGEWKRQRRKERKERKLVREID
jgi:hypothetical protein